MSQYRKEIYTHYEEEYKKILNVESVPKKKVRALLQRAEIAHYSHKDRIAVNWQVLKYGYLFEKTNTITTCFKITYDSTSAIYAFLYSLYKPAQGKGKGGVDHLYVCCGPTFRSQDGEYRHRMIPWDQYVGIFDRYGDAISEVEEHILRRLQAGEISFQTDICYPAASTVNERQFEEHINTLRLPIKLFMICWLCDVHQIVSKIVENHINPAYQYIVGGEEDRAIYESLIQRMGFAEYMRMLDRMCFHYTNVADEDWVMSRLQCGQKIFPITYHEAVDTGDINYAVWREIYVNDLCSSLVLNLISPSFPLNNGWFYVQNSHAGIYDNPAMHDKFEQSKIAETLSTKLREADKYNYNHLDRKKGPVNNKFLSVSRLIGKAVKYSDSNIRLTDLSICVPSEWVGRTVRDLPVLVLNDPGLGRHYSRIFTAQEWFAKYMFEYIYSFYCMNSKVGVIHGDLHINNATIYKLHKLIREDGKPTFENSKIAYIVEDDVYIFDHYGIFGMLIDFSRAILGDVKKLKEDFGEEFTRDFLKTQRNRILLTLFHYFPRFMQRNREKIEGLLVLNFPLIFKIITVVDTYSISSNFAAMISIDEEFKKRKIDVGAGVSKLLIKITQAAEALALDYLQRAIDGTLKDADEIEWPNLTIMKRIFGDYRVTDKNVATFKNAKILEIFNSTNDLKATLDKYENYGPLLSLDTEIELMRKYDIVDKPTENWLEFKKIDSTNAVDILVSKYDTQDEGEFGSSWMYF